MKIELLEKRKKEIIAMMQDFFREEREEELGNFGAEMLYDFFLNSAGNMVYNQAVEDTSGPSHKFCR